jgi:hypothetical protein
VTKKNLTISTTTYTAPACVSVTLVRPPVVNLDPHRHGNLAAAQKYIVQAYQKLDQAQTANRDRLGDHAQRAEDLSPRPPARSGRCRRDEASLAVHNQQF